jgi:hypothetical protein
MSGNSKSRTPPLLRKDGAPAGRYGKDLEDMGTKVKGKVRFKDKARKPHA